MDLTVLGPNGSQKRVSMVLLPHSSADNLGYRPAIRVLDVFLSLMAVLTAILILLKGQRTWSNLCISLFLICLGYTVYILPVTAIANGGFLTLLAMIDIARQYVGLIAMILFAGFLFSERIGRQPRFQALVLQASVGIVSAAALVNFSYLFLTPIPSLPDAGMIGAVSGLLAATLTFGVLLNCWSRSVEPERSRMLLLVTSFGLCPLSIVLMSLSWISWPLYAVGELLALAFQVSFGYAIVRHRVLDIGFVINRVLVFTVISTALLIVFGVTEFAVDKLLHFEGRQKKCHFRRCGRSSHYPVLPPHTALGQPQNRPYVLPSMVRCRKGTAHLHGTCSTHCQHKRAGGKLSFGNEEILRRPRCRPVHAPTRSRVRQNPRWRRASYGDTSGFSPCNRTASWSSRSRYDRRRVWSCREFGLSHDIARLSRRNNSCHVQG